MSSTRLIVALGAAGLLAGLALVGVYALTLPTIQAEQARALQEAIFQVLKGAEAIEAIEVEDETLPEDDRVAYAGRGTDGQLIGYAIPAQGSGFMDTIKVLYGYDPETRTIIGFEVLDSRETPGLGDRIKFDPVFLSNFEALEVEAGIATAKPGEKNAGNQIETISGATISSKAVATMLDVSTQRWMAAIDRLRASEERDR